MTLTSNVVHKAYGILDRAILRFRVTLPLKKDTRTGYLGINALNYLEIASQNKVSFLVI